MAFQQFSGNDFGKMGSNIACPFFLTLSKATIMEANTVTRFSLSIDEGEKKQLQEVAKWARILAVAGLVFLPLFFANTLYKLKYGREFLSLYEEENTAYKIGQYLGAVLLFIVPLIALVVVLRFADSLKKALASEDDNLLLAAFKGLKTFFRIGGFFAIVMAAFAAINFLAVLIKGIF